MTDNELFIQWRKGDGRCFDELVARYSKPLLRFLSRFLDFHAAEDALQDVFMRLYRDQTYRPTSNFNGWIYVVAGNVARDALRLRRNRPFVSLEAMGEEYDLPRWEPPVE